EEERLKTNLQKSEAGVADYKAKNPDALQLGGGTAATGSQQGSGVGGGGPRGGLVEDKLQDLNNKLTASKAERIRLEGELEQIQQNRDNIDALLEIPSIAAAPMVIEARRTVRQIEASITTYALRYKDKHPKMIAAKASLAEAKDKLREAVLAQPAILRHAIEQAKATETSLNRALQDQQGGAVGQAESALGLPVFAAVPETTDEVPVSRLKRKSRRAFGSSNYRVVVETPESPAAEAFRNLRAALALLGPEAERKVSLFTSAVPNEGKSFTSANYSLALAQQIGRASCRERVEISVSGAALINKST